MAEEFSTAAAEPLPGSAGIALLFLRRMRLGDIQSNVTMEKPQS